MNEAIVVIGGGPAGAMAAERLARGGRRVTLFDDKLAWEKPCGGGLTDKAIQRYPFLREAEADRRWIRDCELIGRDGRRVSLRLDRPLAIFPRRELNGLLLERARKAGTELVRARVTGLERGSGGWRVRTPAGEAGRADFVALTAGARSSFRGAFALPFTSEDYMTALGYYAAGTSERVQVRFEAGLSGYIWTFPRSNHLSAGICGAAEGENTTALRRRLEAFLDGEHVEWRGSQFYAHLLPAPREATLRRMRFGGEDWAVAGDAAGLVDPITGEGLYYALRSGELLAEAVLAGEPLGYEKALRADFVPELEWAARVARRFYQGQFLGGAVIDRMLRFTAASGRFRGLMRDLFAGSQGYSGLKRRLYRQLIPTLAEVLAAR